MVIRHAQERGASSLGWLESRHTFSFAHYYDPDHMGFGPLRVINDDRVQPARGFDTHGHQDMEIISYVLEGVMAHEDSAGNGSQIHPGDVQRMTAGTGVYHSENNASTTEPLHFLQIWIVPETSGLTPGYEQKTFSAADKQGQLRLIGSRDGRDDSVTIHQAVDLYAATLAPADYLRFRVAADHRCWLQVAAGSLQLDGQGLSTGDGAAVEGPCDIELNNGNAAEILLFDMAA